MIFFFKSDGTLIKSAPETVYQGSAEAGKVYVVAPLNANMLVDVYYELPNGERWGAYLLENNGTVINNEEFPDGWALWSTTLESAITQYAGTLKAQFGFYQSGTADKVPLITSQGVTITIAKGVVRDLPSVPTADVYAQIVNAISSIKQDIANLPNEYLSNTNEDKIALKNNSAIEYSENATAGTIVKRDSNGKINVADGTEDLNAVNLGQFNAALANKVSSSSVSATAVKDTIAQRTATGQLKAADGVAEDDLATVKQLNAVSQGNYSDITNIELNTGDKTVEYDTELGITVNAKGTLTHKNGSTEQPTTKFEVPIIAGAGVSIDKKEAEEKVEIKSLNSNLENGTADVLIQTTDTNHSFKVMTDGRAKVQTAPTENDDVLRLNEFSDLTKEIADRYVAKVNSKYRIIRDITLEQDIKEVYITTDENGNTFKLKSVFIMYYGKFTGVNLPWLFLRFNGGEIYQMYYGMKNSSISTEQYYRHWIKSDRYGSSNSGETIWQSIFANRLLNGTGQGLYEDNADLASDLGFATIGNSVTEIGYANTTNENTFATGGRIIFWGIDDDE